jgi:tripartite ATP-independent transporter DctM subunit
MGAVIALVVVIALMLLGVPVAFTFAAMSGILAFIYQIDISALMTTGFWTVNSVILMALPLFIMTGYLMQTSGMAKSLVDFVDSLVGRIKGGLGATLVVTCGVFGAISGTATAAVAAIGTVMLPAMKERGYPPPYSAALLAIASLLSILIPPSITMILFAFVTRQSVAAAFLSTIGPGILLIIILCVINVILCRRMPNLRVEPPTSFEARAKRVGRTGFRALPALLMPLVVLGGIYGGIFTPTEASAVAVAYAVPIGFLVYRGLNLRNFTRCLVDAGATTGVIMIILLFALVSSRILTLERIPQALTTFLMGISSNKYVILLLVNVFLIIMGMIMDDVSVTVILSPMLLPTMIEIGVHPIQFGAIVCTSVVIGANSPPVAPILYMACRIGKVGVHEIIKPATIFMVFGALPVMLVTTYWPGLSLFLPRLLGYVK